ncbi:MAG: hypothetical protein U0167_16885 [bacterium]
MQPYAPRRIMFLETRRAGDWRLKHYAIVHGSHPHAAADFDDGIARVLRELPQPAATDARAGVGFLISHRGLTADYVVLAWWDRENELPIRIAVRSKEPGAAWREPQASESICVWDLQVFAFERDAYVATLLGPAGARRDEVVAQYLAQVLSR